MFNLFKKVVESELYSPVKGKMIPLSEVNDPVFSEKMMGDGCAFVFDGDTIYAPCKGEIILIANTRHAIGIKAENGAEILIHIGLDTVNLNGKGFEVLVKEHDEVKAHDPLVRLDRAFMKENKVDLTMPMVITSSDYVIELDEYGDKEVSSRVLKVKKK